MATAYDLKKQSRVFSTRSGGFRMTFDDTIFCHVYFILTMFSIIFDSTMLNFASKTGTQKPRAPKPWLPPKPQTLTILKTSV